MIALSLAKEVDCRVSYEWNNFAIRPVCSRDDEMFWSVVQHGTSIHVNEDLEAAMNFCERLSERLT